ncbi:MAG: MoxR family ATPase [Candidatus Omnitrophica bacterium]|nr:MoxR family ATPase [Candidatus Omnitrophota bacterium]MBU1995637.1 MoxR family ATPase [Candidatus Omnitrophota bacterium]MBU4334005.1 MoxR family ATPase [Candidatus Omnitrophota bacterium]
MSLSINDASKLMQAVRDNIALVIHGKEEKLQLVVLALVSGGHILIEDIPGVGKTTLARAISKTVDGEFNRIQFTPDLLPTDITGNNIFDKDNNTFIFKKGPIFANILLGDEINRASPRTQSALLEAMSEEQVTVDGESHYLPQPFIVIATQNPIDYHGTYPLPEAQLDRFMLQIDLGYPPENKEKALLINRTSADPVDDISSILSLDDFKQLRELVDKVKIEESVSDYLLKIVLETRSHRQLRLGVSTRGTLLYGRIVRARALMSGRDYVIPEDVKELATYVLSHRILLDTKAQYGGVVRSSIIADIISSIKVPR